MISRNQYPNVTLRIASLLSLLLLMSPVSLFSQDSSPSSPDFNDDGIVDLLDYDLFRNQWNTRAGGSNWDAKFDLNGDGVIDLWDYDIFVSNWGKTFPVNNGESSPQQQVTSQVTISAGTTPVTEGTSATFTITANPAPTSPLTVNVDVSEDGDVISGTPSSTVIINANNTTATLTVNTDNDEADESNSVVTAEVESGTGYTVGSSSSASVTVNDNDDPALPPPTGQQPPPTGQQQDAPQVTISAGTTPVTEGTAATFTITASPAPSSPLIVNVDVSEDGDVISGAAPSSVTIDATKTTATLTVNTVNDQSDESNSVVTAEVETGTGYTVGSSSSASVTVNDNDPPEVTISAGTSPVTEGTSATFTITASSAPTSPLIVNVDVSEDGDVISGTPSSTVIINANNTTATLTVNTVNDQTDESNSVITAEVESGIGYTVGSTSSASVTVNDNDDPAQQPKQNAPEVTISAGTTPVTEGTSATFTITASSAPTTAITVSVSVTEDGDVISGTAPSSVTIDATKTTATLTVNTVNDQSDESNSVITAEVQTGTGYAVGSSSSASVTVEDNDDSTAGNENPNLEVWEATVDDASPVQGDQFTLSVSVVNTGKGKSAATTLRYYRSTDATITTGDTAVGTDEVGALSRFGSADESVELTAPTAGTYYYGACVDAVADESDTTDNCSASVEVDVQAPAKRVVISPRSLTFNALGSTATVTVKVLDANGDEDEDASWGYITIFGGLSSGISIEKVNGSLEITSTRTGRGSVSISSDGAKTASLSVSVFQTPASLTLSPSSKSLTVDGTVSLSATIKDANDNDIQLSEDGESGLVVYWGTSDATVATVAGVDADEDGNTGSTATVTAVAAGTATITCRWGGSSGIRGTATITVTDN